MEPVDPNVDATVMNSDYAYNDMLLLINNKITFGIIDKAKFQVHANGDAKLAWSELKKKYELQTGYSEVRLKQDFNTSILSNGEDLDA